jgi:hypothetical protein
VAARSKACVCGHLLAGIAVSNPAERPVYLSHVCTVCRIVGGLCDELITRLGDLYRVCISEYDLYIEHVTVHRGEGRGRG